MATHIGVGFSQNPNPVLAARQAIAQAKTQANQLNIHLAIVFSTIHYCTLETTQAIRKALPDAKIIGSSTAGIILADLIAARGIGILVVSSDQAQFGIGAVSDLDTKDVAQAGTNRARDTIKDFGQHRRSVFMLLHDALVPNAFQLIAGVQQNLGLAFPLTGAGSTDDFRFRKTYQFYQDKLMTSAACGLVIGGQGNIGIGSRHGWKPLGKPRVIDDVEGSVIRKIDGKRASSLYEEYFDKNARDLYSSKLAKVAILYPLGIYLPEENQYLIRNAVDIGQDGSIICQGEVPRGAEVHLMIGNKEYCQQAAVEATQQALDNLNGATPKLALIFESLSRQKLLGRHAGKEIQAIRETLGRSVPIFGMYSHGEIIPFGLSNAAAKTHLQNESIIVMTMS